MIFGIIVIRVTVRNTMMPRSPMFLYWYRLSFTSLLYLLIQYASSIRRYAVTQAGIAIPQFILPR